MANAVRTESDSGLHHVIVRGTGKRILFEDDDDRRFFLKKMHDYAKRDGVEVVCWCLMDNHVHLLMRSDIPNITSTMHSLNTSYARAYNNRHGHVGHVFQGRFRSWPVEDDPYLLELVRYIHLNPKRGGMAKSAQYEWSSYSHFLEGRLTPTQKLILEMLNGHEGFMAHHANAVDSKMIDIALDDEDIVPLRFAISDAEAEAIAKEFFGNAFADRICTMPRQERDVALRRLKGAGLSVRQIERMTGIGRGIIQRVDNF
ncbi:MAG: transposase [Eggerthellaceae bacterium]|nr:transposase [Eggerthellaceae bacterium]